MRPYCQPIRFPQVRFYGASWFASAAACQVARPLCGSDQKFPSHRDFYFQASVESVTVLGAGYNYDSHWIALSMGLSRIGLTSTLAAAPAKPPESPYPPKNPHSRSTAFVTRRPLLPILPLC